MAEIAFPEGWKSLKLSKISVSLLEHLVKPVLGEDTLDLLKEPVEKKELIEKLYDALKTSETQFLKSEQKENAPLLLSLDLRASHGLRDALYEFYQNPASRRLEQLLGEEVLKKDPSQEPEPLGIVIRNFLGILQQNLIAATSSEYREKMTAWLLQNLRSTSSASLAELQLMNTQLKELVAFFNRPEVILDDSAPSVPRESKDILPDVRIDFLLVNALPEEREALLKKLPGHRKLPPSGEDIRIYYQADLPVTFADNSRGSYRVVLVSPLSMGQKQAVAATSDAIRRWHPRYVILVGIAGGIAAKGVKIGDILISDQVVDYELQKLTSQGPEYRWDVQRADAALLNACNHLDSKHWQGLIKTPRPGKGLPKPHIGTIASGDKVVAVDTFLAAIQNNWPKLVGVEMEAAGAATAAYQSLERPGFFMVRGVSDLADENKGKRVVEKWRPYACEGAAAFTVALLNRGPVPLSRPIQSTSDDLRELKNGAAAASETDRQAEAVCVFVHSLLDDKSVNFSAEEDAVDRSRFFVNRDVETRAIQSYFETMKRSSSPLFVLIQGDFGAGKTALMGNFLHLIPKGDPLLVAWTHCVEQEEYVGWVPLIELFKIVLKKALQSGKFEEDAICTYLIRRAPIWLKLAFPEISEDVLKATKYKPEIVHAQFINFIGMVAEKISVVLVFDDLQWADIASLRLISYLAAELRTGQVFILAAYRTEGLITGLNPEDLQKTCSAIQMHTNSHFIDLNQGIEPQDYIRKRYPSLVMPETLVERIKEFSDGHALFIDQLFKHWEDDHVIVMDPNGVWSMDPHVARELKIPRGVEGVLDLRARRMKKEYRKLLNLASAEGEDFTVQVQAQLAKINEDDLIDELAQIGNQSRLIGEKGPDGDPVFTFDFYRFLHRFFREYFYHHLGEAKQRRLHQDIGEQLESLNVRRKNLSAVLALQFYFAKNFGKSITYALQAAREATGKYYWDETVEWCKLISTQMIDVMKNSPHLLKQRGDYLDIYAESMILWMESSTYSGKFDVPDDIITEVKRRLSQQPNSRKLYAYFLVSYAKMCYYGGNYGVEGIEEVRQAVQIFQKIGDVTGEYKAKSGLVDFLVDNLNDFTQGLALQEELLVFAEQHLGLNEQIDTKAWLSWTLCYLGKYDRAVQLASEAYYALMSQDYPNQAQKAMVLRMLGLSYYKWGGVVQAKSCQKDAVEIYHEICDSLAEYWARLELAYTLQALGEYNEAAVEFGQSLQYFITIGDPATQGWVYSTLAKIDSYRGNLENARKNLDLVVALLKTYEANHEDQITTEMALIDYYLASGELDRVPPSLEKIANLFLTYASDLFKTQFYIMYGRYYHRVGDSQQALDYLRMGLDLCHTLHVCVQTAITCNFICQVYRDLGDLEKSDVYQREAQAALDEIGSPWSIEDLNRQMVEWIY